MHCYTLHRQTKCYFNRTSQNCIRTLGKVHIWSILYGTTMRKHIIKPIRPTINEWAAAKPLIIQCAMRCMFGKRGLRYIFKNANAYQHLHWHEYYAFCWFREIIIPFTTNKRTAFSHSVSSIALYGLYFVRVDMPGHIMAHASTANRCLSQ